MSDSQLPLLLVIAGPSGSGKSTLCDRLVSDNRGFKRVTTSTTRAPREGEVNGVHYHFFSAAQFDEKIARGAFLEWAWVHGDRRYGTLAQSVLEPLRNGQNLVLSIDVKGVESIRGAARRDLVLGRSLVTVFISVDADRLLARMRTRGKDDEAEIERRMSTAEAELREAPKFDFVIESRTRDEDFARLLEIVETARARQRRGETMPPY